MVLSDNKNYPFFGNCVAGLEMAHSTRILFLFLRNVSHIRTKKESDFTELIVELHRIEVLL